MVTTIYLPTGMTCEHGARAVTQELEGLGGVRAVAVDLVPGGKSRVTVTTDIPVTDQAITDQAITDQAVAAALDEAGAYRMVAA